MKSFPVRLSGLATLLIAIAAPTQAGRMMDFAEPADLRPATEPEAPEEPVTEMTADGDEPAQDPDMAPEPAEGAGDDFSVKATPAPPPSRWKWTGSLSIGVMVDDNINLSSTHKESDQIFTLGGDIHLLWGLKRDESFLAINYAPTVVLFAAHGGEDAIDQSGGLAGQWRIAKLTMGVQAGVQTLSGGDVDVGDRAQRTLWQIALQARYDYSTKTSFEVNLAPNAADYAKYLNSMEWVNSDWADYQLFPKTRLGMGVTLGYLKPEDGSAQTYEQALLRITNPVTGKLTVNASGGIEFRQFGDGGGTQTTPVFRLSVNYQPFDGTTFDAEASRQIYSSASIVGENFVSTETTVSIHQRLFRRYFATLTGGYEDAKYDSANGQEASTRHDQYFFLRPSISFTVMKWTTIELYFQYRSNTSTMASSAFDDNIAGVKASVTF